MLTAHQTGESLWIATTELPGFPKLDRDISVDVCIVGAGIAGLTTAYLLAASGQKIVLLDNGTIGSGQTQCTSAHLSNVLDARYFEIEQLHGADGARLAAASHTAAIERIARIVTEGAVDCEFRRVDGYLLAASDYDHGILEHEYAAAVRAGLAVEQLTHAPLPHFDRGRCLRFAQQAQFHPLKYLVHLANAVAAERGRVFCQTRAKQIEGGSQARVVTEAGPVVKCKHIVVATNTPVNDLVAIHTKQAPYLTYVIGARVAKGAVETALYWDTADPFHYVRLEPGAPGSDFDILVVGGEDHKTGQASDVEERHDRLLAWARDRFPIISNEVEYRWAGQVMESFDGLAFIGRNPLDKDNVYIATGDSGNGLTHGTIAGMLIRDLILDRPNPWTDLYDPSRKMTGSLLEYAVENLNVATQYTDWLTPGEVGSPDEVLPGHGAIMRSGMNKIALYRDPDGKLTKLSAVCPHLGCLVTFNSVEQTWDCPCHGSRFKADGAVVNGPANCDLKHIEDQ